MWLSILLALLECAIYAPLLKLGRIRGPNVCLEWFNFAVDCYIANLSIPSSCVSPTHLTLPLQLPQIVTELNKRLLLIWLCLSLSVCLFVCLKVDTKFLIHLSCKLCSKLHTILHSVHQQVSEEADNIVSVS